MIKTKECNIPPCTIPLIETLKIISESFVYFPSDFFFSCMETSLKKLFPRRDGSLRPCQLDKNTDPCDVDVSDLTFYKWQSWWSTKSVCISVWGDLYQLT